MRILYGICGEGAGHATRSRVVVTYLLSKGHVVLVAAAGQAERVLRSIEHPSLRVVPIVGLGLAGKDGGVDIRGTVEENAKRLPLMLQKNAAAWAEARLFQPDAVVTDYDSFAWFFANAHALPIVSVDNAQILVRCAHDPALLDEHRSGYAAVEAFTHLKAFACDHFVVTSVFFPPVRPECRLHTTLVPPILRPTVVAALDQPRRNAGHCLVYKTSFLDDASMVEALRSSPQQHFKIYGMNSDLSLPANAERCPFGEGTFLRDLASSRAVVSNGGMSLLGEAVSLGKPVYAVPVRDQYEQVLNAAYVKRLGYGTTSAELDPRVLAAFLERSDDYSRTLAALPPHDRNARLYATIDALLARS